MIEVMLTAGGLSALVLEGIKWVVRKVKKDMSFDFSTAFYTVSLPVLNAVMPFALFWLGMEVADPVLSMAWLDVLKYVITVALSSLVSLVTYTDGIKPLKVHAQKQNNEAIA